jgi:hypothetical protein
MSFATPSPIYQVAVHIPLLQGESPALSVIRTHGDDTRLVRIREVLGRRFHDDIMSDVATIAEKLVDIDRTPSCHVHMVLSGLSLSGGDIANLFHGYWPAESWSYVRIGCSGQQAKMDTSDPRLPMNQFAIPRLAIINAINQAYNRPGQIYMAISDENRAMLEKQLSVFAERQARLSSSDPEALIEQEGESLVVAMGVGIWHRFNAHQLRARTGCDLVAA